VLRGPQATLYGSNSVGGTIKIITAQPDSHTFSGRVEGDASSHERRTLGRSKRTVETILQFPTMGRRPV
jgi:outer membrane receptor for ferrienterochelin and colicin